MNAWYRYSGSFLPLVSAVVLQQSIGAQRVLEEGQPGSGFLPLAEAPVPRPPKPTRHVERRLT